MVNKTNTLRQNLDAKKKIKRKKSQIVTEYKIKLMLIHILLKNLKMQKKEKNKKFKK